jgi:glycosyltransferase involved in cell wall biosynthesis
MMQLAPTKGSLLSLSVVIPVWNGESHLSKCLEALAASTRRPNEIIVVNDSSGDRSAAIAAAYGCKVVTLDKGPYGPATARNRGVSASAGEVVVFIDCDVTVHPDTLGRMEEQFLTHPELSGLFGSYDESPTEHGVVSGYRNLLHHHVHQNSRREASTFWAGCGALRREVFEETNGFDETYRWASIEDIQLGLRLQGGRHQLLLCPEIQATHRKRWNLRQMIYTDIFHRAIPWTRLLLEHGRLPDDLNLRWASRVSAVAAWTLLLFLVFGATSVLHLSALVLPVGVLLACNWGLYRLFHRRRGFVFALGAMALHWLYYLYSSATFVLLVLDAGLRSLTASAAPFDSERVPRALIVRD